MQILLALLPTLIISVLLLIKKINIKNILNGIFYGFISFLFITLFDFLIQTTTGISSTMFNDLNGLSSFAIIMSFIFGSLSEELGKFTSLKLSKSKTKNDIFINAILIGATFSAIENYVYMGSISIGVGLQRLLQPGHIIFQLIMALILIKGLEKNKKSYTFLALIVPMITHSLFNISIKIEFINNLMYIIGIITYIFIIIYILKNINDNSKTKPKLIILKLITVIILTLFIFLIYKNNNIKLNEKAIIKSDNIVFKILSTEKETINDLFDFNSGDYIKVKVEITNNNKEEFELNTFYINIFDNLNKESKCSDSDFMNEPIESGETRVGYLYFKDEGKNYIYLKYISDPFGDKTTYTFNLK